jgi:tripartite-type tricarboxylate transporter receptor subunit TctC
MPRAPIGDTMKRTRHIFAIVAAASLVAFTGQSYAQNYPTKPVKIIVGFAAGGFTDVLARLLAQKMQERLGQSVIVDNKPGATGIIGADYVAKSPADGHTLLLAHVNSNSIIPALQPKLPYDVLKDFTPIVRVASSPMLLVVNPNVPATDVKSFIALAKKKESEGGFSYASSGNGSVQHLAAAQFMQMTNIKMTHVPYKGSGQAVTDLISGQVDLNFESVPSSIQYVKSGKLKALAITSTKRSEILPDVPTIAESGVPGYQIEQWFAIMGPRGMSNDLVQKLNKDLNAILQSPEIVTKVKQQGGNVIGGSPEEFAQFLKQDTVEWAKLIKAANIKID